MTRMGGGVAGRSGLEGEAKVEGSYGSFPRGLEKEMQESVSLRDDP